MEHLVSLFQGDSKNQKGFKEDLLLHFEVYYEEHSSNFSANRPGVDFHLYSPLHSLYYYMCCMSHLRVFLTYIDLKYGKGSDSSLITHQSP